MQDIPYRPATREETLFAISRALNTRHGHELAATIAAEVVLAAMERSGLKVMYDPRHMLPLPGVAPKRG